MFNTTSGLTKSTPSDLLVLFLGKKSITGRKAERLALPASLSAFLKSFSYLKDFKAAYKESALLYPTEAGKIKRLLLIGLGEEDPCDAEKLRELGYLLAEKQRQIATRSNHIMLTPLVSCNPESVTALAEGILFNAYKFERYKTTGNSGPAAGRFTFVCGSDSKRAKIDNSLKRVQGVMKGVNFARDLANTPANEMPPSNLVSIVQSHFKTKSSIKTRVYGLKDLKKKKLNLILAVARGSREEPYLLHLSYSSSRNKKGKSLALIGKGVTFDSGGISIKPSKGMDEMKYDMSGAAAVLGIMDALSSIKPAFDVHGIIPLVENMPGGNAIKPGDVIKSYSGKTVEILNTDAEGRLILADALAYTVQKIKPSLIIDFATLTGAVMVALGDKMAGLFSNCDDLAATLQQAGNTSGDRVWPMPLSDLYAKELDSKTADLKNIGGRWGGSISAAMFLKEFVGKTPWAHIDMAGTANDVKDIGYYSGGATGFGVRLFSAAAASLENLS